MLLLLSVLRDLVYNEKDKHVKNALNQLLDGSNELRTVGFLREVLANHPFSLLKFQKRISRALFVWTQDVFESPILSHSVFPQDDENYGGRLRRARPALRAERGDPLRERMAIAEGVARVTWSPATMIPNNGSSRRSSPRKSTRRSGALLLKKMTATRLDFDDDNDEDYEDEEEPSDDNAHLSELLSPRAQAKTQVNKYEGRRYEDEEEPSDDNAHLSELLSPRARARAKTQVKKYEGRRFWTDKEKSAIKEGIRQLGKGKWAKIKNLYGVILNDRTSMQIKVCSSNCFHNERDAFWL
jgi:hypothetical protein